MLCNMCVGLMLRNFVFLTSRTTFMPDLGKNIVLVSLCKCEYEILFVILYQMDHGLHVHDHRESV